MNPIVIGIAGGSASGKTTLARDLVAALAPDAALVSLDRFYRDLSHLSAARRARVDFDRPERIDWPLFLRTLDRLGRGVSARLPVYDFETHTRTRSRDLLEPPPVLLLDGLWLLRRREVRLRCALGIFVACPARERLRRRVRRDVIERGRNRQEVLRRWRRFAEPGFRRFVAPQAARADLVVRSPLPRGTVPDLARRIRELTKARP